MRWSPISMLLLLTLAVDALAAEEVLRLGVFGHRPQTLLETRYQPLADHLSSRLDGKRIEIELMGLEDLERALRSNRIDLVLTTPSHYFDLHGANSLAGIIATLRTRGSRGTTTGSLGGVIFTRAELDGVAALGDLGSRTIAIPSVRNLGGFTAPAYELHAQGLPLPDPRDLVMVGNHDEVVDTVLGGEADIGFVRTGILEDLIARGRIARDQLRIINQQRFADFPFISSTRLYPEWPLVALPHLDDRTLSQLIAALHLLDVNETPLINAGLAGFAPPADYTTVAETLRVLRLPPFDHEPPVSLGTVWQQYRYPLSGAFVALLIVAGLAILLLRRNQALAGKTQDLRELTNYLAASNELQRTVGQAISTLTEADAQNCDQAIDQLLASLGRHLNADRVYLFQLHADLKHFSNTHEWCAPGISAQLDANQDLAVSDTLWWWQQLADHGKAVIDDVAAMPEEAWGIQRIFEQQGIRSLIGLPLSGKQTPGFIGFDSVNAFREWSAESLQPLEFVTRALGNALIRWRAERELQRSQRFSQTLFESVPVPLFYKDTHGRYLGVNQSFETFFGKRGEELVGKTVFDISPPELATLYDAKDRELLKQGGTQVYDSRVRTSAGATRDVEFHKAVFMDEQGANAGLIGAISDVTARRQQERLLELRAKRDEALLGLPVAAETLDEADFMQYGQEVAEELTGSLIAFIHFINPGEETIELITWSRRTLTHYCNAVFDRHYPVSEAGIWADALRQREPVVFNDYPSYAAKRGLPEGHAQLNRLISVPVIEDGQVVMLTGVGNKPDDYNVDDVETVRLVSNEIWRLVQRRRALDRLELAASVFNHAREGIMVTGPDGTIVDVNEAFCTISGYKREQLLGENPRLLKSDRQSAAFYSEMWKGLNSVGEWRGEIWNRRADGMTTAQLLTISGVRSADGNIKHFVALFSDINAQKKYQRQLEYIAHYDALTGLPNRVLLGDRILQALSQAHRRKQNLAVAYLDLDGFKEINDQYGHETGDQLLSTVASRMRMALREGDTVARLGGDEFVLVLLDLATHDAVVPELNRVLDAVAQPVQLNADQVQIAASVGVTFYPQREEVDADLLLRQADQAMYQAKLLGRNRFQLFQEDPKAKQLGEIEILQRMHDGLAAGEFVFHLQPKVDMHAGQVIGAELLIRWQHPDQGMLSPYQFLRHASDRPLMAEFGRRAITTALQWLTEWRRRGLGLHLSVNIDAYHLEQPDFSGWLQRELQRHPDVDANSLVLEVLESSALEDLELVSRVIAECRELGVLFSLDDFGTGYSSLTYLKNLPASELKIDKSFVNDCLEDPEDLAILEGVIGMAVAFQRQVVAEGVETEEHGEMLLALGCQRAQGYAIAKPMPLDAFETWLPKWRCPERWLGARPIAREYLPALFAGVGHRAWISQVERWLQTAGMTQPADIDACRLGRWLSEEGKTHFGDNPAFAEIEQLHDRTHGLVDELAVLRNADSTDEAIARLPHLKDISDRLMRELRGLLSTETGA